MDITLFISILSAAAVITSLLTEAIKKMYSNMNRSCSPNVIALVNAIVIGCGGTAVVYMLMGIEWTVNNVICMVLMAFAVWLSSMLGFDKVIQMINQMAKNSNKEEKSE